MEPTTRGVTAEELLRLPDDGWRYELIGGELRKMTPSGFRHGVVVAALTRRLGRHVDEHQLGLVCGAETGFILARSPDTVRAPDVAFVRRDRIARFRVPAEFWPGAPDLAVEVTSPSDAAAQVDAKAREWLAAGTRVVWVLHCEERTVTVWRGDGSTQILRADDMLEGEDVVPGFECRVGGLFRDLD